MRVVNTRKGKSAAGIPAPPANWTYDRVRDEFRKLSPAPTRIDCDIVAFNDLLNDKAAIRHFDPVTVRSILATGHYANLEIDGQWLEVHVAKTNRFHSLRFA